MGFGCPICSEQLHRLPAEATQLNTNNPTDINISATPCGHLFHTYCINKWLGGSLASSKQCPCCRKAVPGSRILPLYPNGYDDSILDDSSSQQSTGQCDHTHLNITIGSLRAQVGELNKKFDEADMMLKIQKDVADENKKKYEREKVRSDHMTYQWKQYESYKDYAEQKERECQRLSGDLKKYHIIDSLVRGSKEAVEDELNSFPPTSDSINTLLEIIEALKQELNTACRKNNETKKDQEAGRLERQKLHAKLLKLQTAYDELRRIYDGSFNSSASKQVSEDRVYNVNVLNVNRTPLLMASKVSRKLVMNYEDDPIDEDVSLIQPFVYKSNTNKADKTRTKSKKAAVSATVTSDSVPSTSSSKTSKTSETPIETIESQKTLKNEVSNKAQSASDILKTKIDSRKRKSAGGCQKSIKKIQKMLQITDPHKSTTEPNAGSCEAIKLPLVPVAKSNIIKKLSKLTKCDLSPIPLNQTIHISSSDDDDELFSPMQLKGNIPGLKVTPFDRPSMKSAAGRALIKGIRK